MSHILNILPEGSEQILCRNDIDDRRQEDPLINTDSLSLCQQTYRGRAVGSKLLKRVC